MIKLFFFIIFGILFSQQIPNSNTNTKSSNKDPYLQETIDKYEELIKKYPNKSGIHYNLGNLKYLSGDHEGAIEAFRKDLSNNDNQLKSDALYNIGNTLYELGKYQESSEYFKQAIEINPNDKDAKINYEISKRMLEKQQEQQKNSEQDQENQQQDENSEQDQENQQQDENSEQNQENQQQDENSEQNQPYKSEEEKLEKEEAESILNALQANHKNLMKKKYRAKNRIKLEKDW